MKTENKTITSDLRQKAEYLLKKKSPKIPFPLSEADMLSHIHEMHVQQIELQIQAEELIQALSASQDAIELYDFAPSGYFTLSKEGEIIDLNLCGSQMLGKERSILKKSRLNFFVSENSKPTFNLFLEKIFKNKIKETCEVGLITDGNLPLYVQLSGIITENEENCLITATDITERKKAEERLNFFAVILEHLNMPDEWQNLIRNIMNEIKSFAGFDALGIRLKDGLDFPYYIPIGFPENFTKEENFLCAKSKNGSVIMNQNGLPILECTCGLVLSGNTDASKPYFTEGGSFWTNKSTDFLSLPINEDPRINPRNICIHLGYMSIALVPIYSDDEIIGLLHFNSKLPNSFTLDLILFFEKIASVIGVAYNRMLFEKRIKESEEKFKNLVETTNDIIWETDAEGYYTYVSPQVEDILGFKPEELIDRSPFEFMPPDEAKKNKKKSDKIIASKKSFEGLINVALHKDGHLITIETNGVPIIDAYNNLLGYRGIDRDITERKRSEEELLKSEEHFRNIFEQASGGIFIADQYGNYTDVNSAGCQMLGYTKEEIIKLNIIDIVSEDEVNRINSETEILLRDGITKSEWKFRRKDNMVFLGEIVTKKLSDGRLQAFVHDITDHKRKEEELIQAKKKAEENDRLKSAFLANMSHEIRTPMNGIIGYSEFLLEGNISETEQHEYATIVNTSAKRLLTLITNIMDISKIESGQMQVKINIFNINKLFREIYNTKKYLAENKQLSLSFNLGLPDEEANIKSYEFAFYQILINLLTNAFKYTVKGSVEFGYTLRHTSTLRQAQGSVAEAQGTVKSVIEFYVKDTGIGISKEYLPKIFNRFSQQMESMNRKYEGAGLGLSIVKGLLDLIKGEISIETEQGKGTCMTVRIPCFENVSTHVLNKNVSIENVNLKNASILIVEDDEASFHLLKKQILRVSEIKIYHAVDGYTAIEQVKQNPDITCVLMDLHLPDMDGLEATKNIKQTKQDLPVVAVTAAVMQRDKDNAFNSGCDAFFSKPVDIKKLLALIAKYNNGK